MNTRTLTMGEYVAYGVLRTCRKPVTITDLHNRANALMSRNHFQKVMVAGVDEGHVEITGTDEEGYGRPGKLYQLTAEGREIFKEQHDNIKATFNTPKKKKK